MVPRLGPMVVYKGWVQRPKAGPKVGSKCFVLRLGFEAGSKGRVPLMDPNVRSHG